MKRILIAAALIATPATALVAGMGANIPLYKPASAGPGNVAVDMSAISGGAYKADPAHTLVGFRVNHLGFNDYFGTFGDVSGTLNLDKANIENSSVSVTVPLSGLVTASSDLTTHLKTPDFFEAASHDSVTFTSTSVKRTSPTTADIMGNLTIKGTTKPVTLHAEFTGTGPSPMSKVETVGFEASTMIKRSDFGVDYGIDMVSDEVALDITAAFEKQ